MEKVMVQAYRDLTVWQKAFDLVITVYQKTQDFPKHELFGLTGQVRRAAISIPSNIAEGRGKLTKGEFKLFLGHARGSLAELETQILIARHLNYLNDIEGSKLMEQIAEVGRLLNGLLSSVKSQ
jgi:four helix bundle protein